MGYRRFLLITASLIAGAVAAAGWLALVGALRGAKVLGNANIGGTLTLLLVTAAVVGVRFVRWHYLLRRAEIRVSARTSLSLYLASLVGVATPAYLGEAIRCGLVRSRCGVAIGATLHVFVVERLLDIASLASLCAITATDERVRTTMAFVAVAAAAATFLGRVFGTGFGLTATGHNSLHRSSVFFVSFGMSLVAWTLLGLQLGIAAASVGASVTPVDGTHVVSFAALLGGFTLLPWGATSASDVMIERLGGIGLAGSEASAAVALLVLVTTGVMLALGFSFLIALLRSRASRADRGAAVHFDAIAADYENQFSKPIWNYLLERKVSFLAAALPSPNATGVGLDLGCGLGIQCLALAKRGYTVVGMDISRGLAGQAHRAGVAAAVGSALALPFRDQSLDFVYAVGVLHHLPDQPSQEIAYREVVRVLKPGGRFLVHETNPRNPLFRFYMGYVFPVLKRIDEGVEWWISPDRWKSVIGLRLVNVNYFTFMPDFIPNWLLPPFKSVDRLLERSALRPYSVHYMAALERDSASAPSSDGSQGPTPTA